MLVLALTAAVRGAPAMPERMWRDGVELSAPTIPALVAGCGPVREVAEPSTVVGWVDTQAVLAYQTPVPAAGWFYREPADENQLDGVPERVLRSMWEGKRALWVDASATDEQVELARAFTEQHPELRLHVWRWPSAYQQLPRTYAIASWGITQECQDLDAGVIEALLSSAPPAPGVPGQQPPAGFPDQEDQ